MNIRNATQEDKKGIYVLSQALATSFTLTEEVFTKSFIEIITDKNASLIIAEYENVIVGYCLAFHHTTFYANGRVTWVEELMVAKKYRSQGIGSLLMKEIEHIAKNMNSRLIALATRRASQFYTKHKYKDSAVYFKKKL